MKSLLLKLLAALVLSLSAMTYFAATPAAAQGYYCRDGFDGYGRPCRGEFHHHRHLEDAPVIIETPAPIYAEPPRGWVQCAAENGFCRVPFPTRVRYGSEGYFAFIDVNGRGIPCNNRAFGDPARGLRKACWFLNR